MMNKPESDIPGSAYAVAIGLPDELVLDTLDARLVAAEVLESEMADLAPDAEHARTDAPVSMPRGWKAGSGTIIIVLALLTVSIVGFLCLRQVRSWDQLNDEERDLVSLVVWCLYAAIAGAIARWLTLAARGIPGASYNLAEYLRRWLADVVSTALIVTVVLVVARSISIQTGTITLSLSEASRELLIALAFVLGFFARRARKLLYNISHLTFLQREESREAEEQRRNDHSKDVTESRD